MAVLSNIVISDSVLESHKPDIATLLFEGQEDFAAFIERVKEQVYGEIKIREEQNFPGLSDAELDEVLEAVRDYANEKYLEKRIACLVVAEIFAAHGNLEQAMMWKDKAAAIPLRYFIDINEDVQAGTEERRVQAIEFGR
jgi:hypothetical protein